jgi:hypothetical protein
VGGGGPGGAAGKGSVGQIPSLAQPATSSRAQQRISCPLNRELFCSARA